MARQLPFSAAAGVQAKLARRGVWPYWSPVASDSPNTATQYADQWLITFLNASSMNRGCMVFRKSLSSKSAGLLMAPVLAVMSNFDPHAHFSETHGHTQDSMPEPH